MSDSFTVDDSTAGEPSNVSEGLDSTFVDSSNLDESDAGTSTEPISESDTADSFFEIDGKGITLEEARNGYLRQSDYTKKTQELAEMRTRLSDAEAITEALRNDPTSTLKALGDAFGVGFDQQEADLFDGMDPDEQRIFVLEQKFAAQEATANQAAIGRELESIRETHGDFDESSLFAHAIKGGFPNLQSAYADMNFGSMSAKLSEFERKQQDGDKRTAAKRDAAGTVYSGSNRSGTSVPNESVQFGSLREAFLAAKKSLGA